MNPEILDMYKRLQPFFREKMGKLQTGDWVFHKEKRKVFWVAYPEGSFLFVYDREYGSYREIFRSNAIFLPLPIDPVNPERGLWGMVDWELFNSLSPNPVSGEWYIFGMTDRRAKGFSSEWQTPTLALLKALAAQERVKV